MKKIIISAIAIIILNACTSNPAKEQSAVVEEESVVAAPVQESTGVIVLEASDQMQYNRTELKAKVGEEITLQLVHTGTMQKAVMGHNFVLLKQGTDVDQFAALAMSAASNEYIPESDAIIANTKLIGGGESDEIKFSIAEAGSYDYICSFPGHYAVMRGKLVVE